MEKIVVSEQDIEAADTFLTAYLKESVPEADWDRGTNMRDFVIKAIAYVYAYLQREIKAARDRQSLLTLANLPASESVDDAVDAILANWFMPRKKGRASRVPTILHFSRQADVVIPAKTRFWRTANQVFYTNSTLPLVIPSSDLAPVLDAGGNVEDYTATVLLVAEKVGTDYNVAPGRFVTADSFSPYFTYAENKVDAYDGRGKETTAEMIERAPQAISVRNLINSRSITTVLREQFPELDRIVVAGHGDPEMTRDLTEEAATKLRMHVGGRHDIYADLPRTHVTETLTVGGAFPVPGGAVTILRDTAVTFTGTVLPGHVLFIQDVFPVPRQFIITHVREHELEVSDRTPFSYATDELTDDDGVLTPQAVTYSVGKFSPFYADILAPRTGGFTSRITQLPNSVTLTARPHYDFVRIDIGTTTVTARVNTTPTAADEYQVIEHRPTAANSGACYTRVVFAPEHEGQVARITYDTLTGYEDIQAYVTDSYERVVTGNALVRGLNPVYLSADISLALRKGGNSNIIADMKRTVADYVNAYRGEEPLDVSAIIELIRTTYPDDVAAVLPFQIEYVLYGPDGNAYRFTTEDQVTLAMEDGVNLDNRAELGLADSAAVVHRFASLGITDRTVRYYCNSDDVNPSFVR